VTTATAPAHVSGTNLDGIHLSFVRLIRSEWIKLRSIRSTMWCYLVLFVLSIALSVLPALAAGSGSQHVTGANADAAVVTINTISIHLTALVVGVLGVLIITGEYGTGQIRSTFTADPRRYGAFFAKALVLAATTFVVSAASVWIGALASAPILNAQNIDVNLGHPSVFLPILGGSVYVTLVALLAFGIGTLIRASAGGVAITLGLLLVVPGILVAIGSLINAQWLLDIAQFLPSQAGGQLSTFSGDASGAVHALSTDAEGVVLNGWEGFWVLLAEVVAVGAAALVLVKRRDA